MPWLKGIRLVKYHKNRIIIIMIEFLFYVFSTLLVGSALAVVFARNPVHSVLFLIFAFFNVAGLFVLLEAEFLAMLLVIVYVGAVAVLFLFVVMMMDISPASQRPVFSLQRSKQALGNIYTLFSYAVIFSLVTLAMISIAPIVDAVQQAKQISMDNLVQIIQQSAWFVFAPDVGILYLVTTVLVTLFVARGVTQLLIKTSFIRIVSSFADSLLFMFVLGITILVTMIAVAYTWQSSNISSDLVASPTPPSDLMTNTHALGQIIYGDYILAFQACGIILLVAMIGAIVLTHRKREGVKKQDIFKQVMRKKEDTLSVQKMPLGKGVD